MQGHRPVCLLPLAVHCDDWAWLAEAPLEDLDGERAEDRTRGEVRDARGPRVEQDARRQRRHYRVRLRDVLVRCARGAGSEDGRAPCRAHTTTKSYVVLARFSWRLRVFWQFEDSRLWLLCSQLVEVESSSERPMVVLQKWRWLQKLPASRSSCLARARRYRDFAFHECHLQELAAFCRCIAQRA